MAQKLSYLLVALLLSKEVLAQGPADDHLVYQIPQMAAVSLKTKISFATIHDTTLSFDIYYPPGFKPGTRLPLVIFNNGVGALDIPTWGQYKDWCRLIAASGMVAIIHQARPGGALEDGETLLDYLLIHGRGLGIDTARIGLWTCSANGRAGSRIAFKTRPKNIKALVMYYAVTDSLGTLRQDLPTFLVRAGLDAQSLNSSIESFVQSCLVQDIRLEFINYLNGMHAFDLFTNSDESREIIKKTVAFLKTNLANPVIQKEFVLTNRNFMWLVNNNEMPKAIDEFRKARSTFRADSSFQPFFNAVIRESILNTNGYWLRDHQRVSDAIKLFKLGVESYPESPNAYESLSEAYEIAGNKTESIVNAEKCLQKLPGYTPRDSTVKQRIKESAEARIARLK